MTKAAKYTPATAEEEYFLALESILRWTNRQGYPAQKIRAIRKVAQTALLRDEYERAKKINKTWTPSYLTLGETDDHGTPVPAVMRKVIDKFVPQEGS